MSSAFDRYTRRRDELIKKRIEQEIKFNSKLEPISKIVVVTSGIVIWGGIIFIITLSLFRSTGLWNL